MKTLREFIQENWHSFLGIDIEGPNYKIQDGIQETLMSHDGDKLIDKIHRTFGVPKNEILHSPFGYSTKSLGVPIRYIDIDKLRDILVFYGWYVTIEEYEGYCIIEPIYTLNITDKIHDDCHDIIYKIVSLSDWDIIKNRGAIFTDRDITFRRTLHGNKPRKEISKEISKLINIDIRDNDMGFRKYSSRQFFFSGDTNKHIQEAYKEVTGQLRMSTYKVLKIDISQYHINCYEDTHMGFNIPPRDEGVYLFYLNGMIPIDYIECMNKKEFEKWIGLK